MHFLVDECTGPAVARWLRAQKHEVFSVYQEARGMEAEEVVEICRGNAIKEMPELVRVVGAERQISPCDGDEMLKIDTRPTLKGSVIRYYL